MKKSSTVRVLIMNGAGINCEQETFLAWQLVGADAHIVHVNKILSGECSLCDYDVLTLPGGFSFGDELGSGKILANLLKYSKLSSGKMFFGEINRFLEKGKFIFGICNGFQALVQSGLLPDIAGKQVQEATLTFNISGHFVDKWVSLQSNLASKIILSKKSDILSLPIRHGEGRLLFANDTIKLCVEENNLHCLSYTNNDELINGSELACAALINPSAQILGMMPHPEGYLSLFNHPEWPLWQRQYGKDFETGKEPDGLHIFQNILKHIEVK